MGGAGQPVTSVAYVLDSPTYGGAEECVLQLLRGLPAQVRRSVVATDPAPAQLVSAARASGDLVLLAPVRGRADGAAAVSAALRRLAPDLAHVNLIDPATCVEALEGAVRAGPSVATVHLSGTLGTGAARARLAAAYAALAGVIVPSREIGETLRHGLGVPVHRLHHVRNGAPVDDRALVRDPVRRQPGHPRPVRIGVHCRLTAQKGIDLLIEASRRLVGAGLEVEVCVGGEGRDRDALVARSAGLPVNFPGFVADVPGFLDELDVFCLPSRADALPLSLLEALMSGLPCVTTAVGDIPQVVGDLAVVVPPQDVAALTEALAVLVGHPQARARLGRQAAAAARARFPVSATVASVLDIYAEALGTVGSFTA